MASTPSRFGMMDNAGAPAPHSLGSPERGAVTALCAVTEGLVQGGWGVPTLPVNPRRAGVEARPYEVWGGGMAQ